MTSTWWDDDRFWELSAPVIFTEARMRGAAGDVEGVVRTVEPPAGCAVLDLGCGIGRHSMEFARRGFRVTGVDRTQAYLDRAAKSAKEAGLSGEWVREDMRRFRRANAFDLAVSLLTSFGYFDDPADDLLVLRNVFDSLRPGGTVLLDLMGREVLARIFRERDWHEEPGGLILLEQRRAQNDWERLAIRWIVLNGSERHELDFFLRVYTAADLRDLLTEAGFKDVRILGGLNGEPYDHQAMRLVAVGRK